MQRDTKGVYSIPHNFFNYSNCTAQNPLICFTLVNKHESKRIEGARAICNSTLPFADIQLGICISSNSFGDINTAKSLSKGQKAIC